MSLTRLVQAFRSRREAAALARRPIPDGLWKRTLVRYPFLQRRRPEDAELLRRMTSLFLDRKEFSASGGLHLTDAMAVAVAAQATLPVLRLGLQAYDSFVGIVLHPGQVVTRREWSDDAGVVHVYDETLAGEAVQGGPVMLSWADVRAAGSGGAAGGLNSSGYNVVIHEFAHVLDMAHGGANGMPPLPPGLSVRQWQATLTKELLALRAALEAEAPTLLDPYAAQSEEEFFAVSSEIFFTRPNDLRTQHADWYTLLCALYGQNPAEETATKRL